MIRHIITITILFVGMMNNCVRGQVFNIQAVNGSDESIQLSPDYGNSILTIICSKDTLFIQGITDIKATNILNKNFLLIVYSIRGGSGIDLRRTLILCVKNKLICQSIHITSLFSEEYIDFRKHLTPSDTVDEKSYYDVRLSLVKSDIQNYKLNTKIHDEKMSRQHPENNYNHYNNVDLNFDRNQDIFYTKFEDLSQYFTVFDPKTQTETKQYIMGKFAVVKLGDYQYYYIKGEWYEIGTDNSLSKYSYK